MILCENSVFEKKKKNLIELDIIKTHVDGAIGIKLFLTFFHPQIEAGALGFARIYKAGAERDNILSTDDIDSLVGIVISALHDVIDYIVSLVAKMKTRPPAPWIT